MPKAQKLVQSAQPELEALVKGGYKPFADVILGAKQLVKPLLEPRFRRAFL